MVKVGDKIRILYVDGEPNMCGLEGTVTKIDDIGQIHGSWSGVAICEDYGDSFEIIEKAN